MKLERDGLCDKSQNWYIWEWENDSIIDDTNAELRRVGIQIKSDSDKLAKKWSELKKQVNAWSRIIDDAHAKMEQLAAAIAECQLSLSKMEANMESMQPVEEVRNPFPQKSHRTVYSYKHSLAF